MEKVLEQVRGVNMVAEVSGWRGRVNALSGKPVSPLYQLGICSYW